MPLAVENVSCQGVNNQNNHHDLKLVVTKAELAMMGITTDDDVEAIGHCCDCPAHSVNFMIVDEITVGDVTANKSQEHFEYDPGEFPFDEAKSDFVAEVAYMLDQIATALSTGSPPDGRLGPQKVFTSLEFGNVMEF